MQKYFHSVRLDEENCKGCTNCIKRCPTEAIRVRKGRARIIEERCIDCGECIRICPNHAKIALTDDLQKIKDYQVSIALPAPSLYAQFKPEIMPGHVLRALIEIGFDDVFEVAVAAEIVSDMISKFLRSAPRKPYISSACPAVVRLMQVRFPGLLDQIIPVETPMEVAARIARKEKARKFNVAPEKIGIFFITPCPAKVTAVKQPFGTKSEVDGAISMSSIYGNLLHKLDRIKAPPLPFYSTPRGIGWGKSGGENRAIEGGFSLAVDGIHNVISVLEEIERGELTDINYVEAQACTGGCIGGPLVPQNPFISRVRMENLNSLLADKNPVKVPSINEEWYLDKPINPRPVMQLSNDVTEAIQMLSDVEKIVQELPGLDCGSCGSPNCKALAEDIVRGYAQKTYCVFKLREKLRDLAKEMVELAHKPPPAMGRKDAAEEEKRDVPLE